MPCVEGAGRCQSIRVSGHFALVNVRLRWTSINFLYDTSSTHNNEATLRVIAELQPCPSAGRCNRVMPRV